MKNKAKIPHFRIS